jgi:hypothetical protein
MGIGFVFNRYSVDYAWVPVGELGMTHQVSLNYRFSEPQQPGEEIKQEVPVKKKKKPKTDSLTRELVDLFAELNDVSSVKTKLESVLTENPDDQRVLIMIDQLNNISSDTVKPVIKISTGLSIEINVPEFEMLSTITDETGLKYVQIDTNTYNCLMKREKEVTIYKQLTPGNNTIEIKAVDLNMNIATTTVKVFFDNEPP